jgi:ABC-type transporter Mla subunit MlaD
MQNNKSLDFWVGLFVLLGAAAFLFLALRVGNMGSISLNDSYTVSAKFDKIGGLKPLVWWLGVLETSLLMTIRFRRS